LPKIRVYPIMVSTDFLLVPPRHQEPAMSTILSLKNALAAFAASICARIAAYTDALNQARAQSGRFSGAYW